MLFDILILLYNLRDLYYKFLNDEHHDEFELSQITLNKVSIYGDVFKRFPITYIYAQQT